MDFTITTTATLRPELLKVTFDSFVKNFFKDQVQTTTLLMNVDPVGHDGTTIDRHRRSEQILRIVYGYGFKHYNINFATEPHFGRAFVWLMDKIKTEFFFHLEEDWELVFPMSLPDMVSLMNADQKLAHLRLSQFKSVGNTMKTWNKFMEWNGSYFQVPLNLKGGLGWAGHPSLNRTSFMQSCLQYIDPNRNPEKQLKARRFSNPKHLATILNSNFGIFHPLNSPASIVDIGRKWMVKNGWAKKGTKAFFTQWETVK